MSDAPGLFCILTPKNVVGYYKYDLETGISKYSNSRRCTFTATLYSSFISGNKSSELLIFGGTAFGDLVIWSPLLEENEPIKIFSRIHNVCASGDKILYIKFWLICIFVRRELSSR